MNTHMPIQSRAKSQPSGLSARPGILQRKRAFDGAPSVGQQALYRAGRPLASPTQDLIEARIVHDFSQVRIHYGELATNSVNSIDALTHPVGTNIALASNHYQPRTVRLTTNPARDTPSKRPADHMVVGAATGLPVVGTHLAAVSLQRSPEDGAGYYGDESYNEDINIPDEEDLSDSQVTDSSAAPVIYMCSKALDRAPVGTHAFFRVGSPNVGSPTYSLVPEDRNLFNHGEGWGSGCFQGQTVRDVSSDFNATAECEATSITLSCLQSQYDSYPIGNYCTLGPNSNTFVGHVARQCGISNPDPAGWNPGIDDEPPEEDTYSPSPEFTLVAGCQTKNCGHGD